MFKEFRVSELKKLDVNELKEFRISEFRIFLKKNNAVALAVGFIMGAAVSKVVTALVNDLIMPIIGMAIPDGDWRKLDFAVGTGKFLVGDFIGTVVDFFIIAFVVFVITKTLLKEPPAPEPPPMKNCKACTESVPMAATKCKFCGDPV